MVPSFISDDKSMMDIVTQFELRLLEPAGPFSYLTGEAEFTLRPVHEEDNGDEDGHQEALRGKMDSIDVQTKQMDVHVTDNPLPGSRVGRQLTLRFDYLDGDSDFQIVNKIIDGMHYDTSIKIDPSEWVCTFDSTDTHIPA